MFQKLKTFVTGKDATGHSSGSFATPTTADSVLRTLTEIASELHARSVALEDALKHTDVHVPSAVPDAIASLAAEYLEWEKSNTLITNGSFNEVDMRHQDAWTKAALDSYHKRLLAAIVLVKLQSTHTAFSLAMHGDENESSVREIMQNVQHALSKTKTKLQLIDTWAVQALAVIG
mgnify:CR=1 FL=1